MPITISGTTVTFNDSSTQTTNVPNATAALTAGAIGTYAHLYYPGNSTDRSAGFTLAGSSLRYTSGGGFGVGPTAAPSGTWRLMGDIQGQTFYPGGPKGAGSVSGWFGSVWLRLS
jgi:hypothetical protein